MVDRTSLSVLHFVGEGALKMGQSVASRGLQARQQGEGTAEQQQQRI